MATTREAQRLIHTIPPTAPIQYLVLSEFGEDLEDYYATRDGSWEAVIWAWADGGRYGEEPTEDRRFDIRSFEQTVSWLGREESKPQDESEQDPSQSVVGVGTFTWEDPSTDTVLLILVCGDERRFVLRELEVLAKALRAMEATPDNFYPSGGFRAHAQ